MKQNKHQMKVPDTKSAMKKEIFRLNQHIGQLNSKIQRYKQTIANLECLKSNEKPIIPLLKNRKNHNFDTNVLKRLKSSSRNKLNNNDILLIFCKVKKELLKYDYNKKEDSTIEFGIPPNFVYYLPRFKKKYKIFF